MCSLKESLGAPWGSLAVWVLGLLVLWVRGFLDFPAGMGLGTSKPSRQYGFWDSSTFPVLWVRGFLDFSAGMGLGTS